MAAERYLSRRIPNSRAGNIIGKIDKKPVPSIYVLEHRLHGSNVKCLTSIMMVRARLGLGYCLVAAKQLCHIQSSY